MFDTIDKDGMFEENICGLYFEPHWPGADHVAWQGKEKAGGVRGWEEKKIVHTL